MHRPVPLGGGNLVNTFDLDLDDCRRAVFAVGRLLADDLEVLEFEERAVLAELLAPSN